MHNPWFAGVFVHGRKRAGRTPQGKPTLTDVPREEWTTFLPGHHEGYITVEQWEASTAVLLDNATSRDEDRKAGPPCEGPAPLQGLVICGKCGRRMTVGHRQFHHDFARHRASIRSFTCNARGPRICSQDLEDERPRNQRDTIRRL
ncbi:recombinase zinc beta ribbon domain-containing protein [Streptomyces sp. NPDC007264]|uniref:recombinase zinc beta ribbon domain-containing protein n=1 Tax=Streptomyces sp. NPDC007264 TaxID=3364777 RepID=UPI0036DB5823